MSLPSKEGSYRAISGNGDIIVWSKDYKLKWEDFQGNGDTAKVIGAKCSSTINYDFTPKHGDTLKLVIEADFYKNESVTVIWRLKAANDVDQALQHEQIHFDITELYARKVRKMISVLINRAKRHNSNWIMDKFTNLYYKIMIEYMAEQKLFDKDVSFFDTPSMKTNDVLSVKDIEIVRNAQDQWRQRVNKKLSDLEAYKKNTFTIKVKKNNVMY